MRINKYLSQCGVGSRRKCDEYISRGLVRINGKIVKDFSYKVSRSDYVQYNNQLLELDPHITYILNKPKGYICSKADNLRYDVLKRQRDDLYKDCVPLFEKSIKINKNQFKIKLLMDVYGTLGDTVGYNKMKKMLD